MATGFFTTLDLSPYLVDKDSGYPLAGGYVQFWVDADRTTPKLVFEKQNIGADPVTGQPIYQYVPLSNPITLSAVGTIQNSSGNNVALYYYPFDANGDIELYYVAVFNSLGVQQFTREGWGFNDSSSTPVSGSGTAENMLSNPQFSQINFNPDIGFTYTFNGTTTVNIPIAPDWTLQVSYSGAGNVTVNRTAIQGSLNYETNPPYVLSIAAGNNISALNLIQRLTNNPGIWSPQTLISGGYLAGFMLLGPSSSAKMIYAPSIGATTQVMSENNASSSYVGYSNTVQLPASANTATADTGYVDIKIQLPTTGTTLISSLQVAPFETNVTGVEFVQEPVNRQVDHLFNFYNPLIQFMPTPSYLVGWDFALNPAQPLGPTVSAFSTGNNKSNYVWDNTIVFQTVNSGLSYARTASGALQITSASNTAQAALVQYAAGLDAALMVYQNLCAVVSAISNVSGGLTACVSLWGTANGSLPSTIGSNTSMVSTLDANGHPATVATGWLEIARNNLGNAIFKIGANNTLNTSNYFNNYPLSYWTNTEATLTSGITFFAIVVGTAVIPSTKTVTFQSIALQPGIIPTIPAAVSRDVALNQCRRFYNMSFPIGTVPAQAAGITGSTIFPAVNTNTGQQRAQTVNFQVEMYAAPTVTIYNPINANAQVYNVARSADCGSTAVANNYANGFSVVCVGSSPTSVSDDLAFQWSSDARLGQ